MGAIKLHAVRPGAGAVNLTQNPVTVRGVLDAIKRGHELTEPHVRFFVSGIADGSIPDYQAAAFLMAVRLKGLGRRETAYLTQAMTDSGKRLDLSGVPGMTVDKHSTGGISDGTSFIVAALLASFGLKIPMMSGRGLGHTGGTLDKLEAIPGFRVSLTAEEVVAQLRSIGLAIFGQTADIAPADKKMYGLRDVTETVDSIPLIVGSIMSKKLAEGARGLVMNVTTGSGAFMRELEDAMELAEAMVAVAQQSGVRASAVVSSMDEPLAPFVGNALEIQQAVRILRGETEGFERFIAVSIELAAHLMVHGGRFAMAEIDMAKKALRGRLASGIAFGPFRDMVMAQGGDVHAIDDWSRLPQAASTMDVRSPHAGFVGQINATQVGLASVYLGAGRETAGAPIDPAVGLQVFKFVGDAVEKGEPLARLYVNDPRRVADASAALVGAYTITPENTGMRRGPILATVLGQLAAVASLPTIRTTSKGIEPDNMDRSVDPTNDFYRFVNGGWMDRTGIPDGHPAFGAFGELRLANQARFREILDAAATAQAPQGSAMQKLGDFYASGMDEAALNQADAVPLHGFLDMLEDISLSDPDKLEECVAWLLRRNIPGIFVPTVDADPKDSTRHILTLDQGGLGLPERDYYFRDDDASIQLRAAYVQHIAKTFELLGDSAFVARQKAAAVMAIETTLAESSLTPTERRDLNRQYNKMTVAELLALAPHWDWVDLLAEMGMSEVSHVVLTHPDFFKAMNHLMEVTPLRDWEDYLTWQWVNGASEYLGDRFADHKFEFYGKTLDGMTSQKPRSQRVLEQADAWLGDALGRVFVDRYFPETSKQRVNAMVDHLAAAFRARIQSREWMSDATKLAALEKLDKVARNLGFPDQWKDYATVNITRDSYLRNVLRAREYEFDHMVGKLGKPVDRGEWSMTAPTVNAEYDFGRNRLLFPAGILQPPFFNADADDAVNYGAIGAIIGHELTHGFDDQGALYDADGNMRNWWSDADKAQFEARTLQLVRQFNDFVAIGNLHVNGQLTLGENVADLGGLVMAYDALQRSLEGKHRTLIDGLTPEQRFFMGWAQVWRIHFTPAALEKYVRTNVHAPGHFRVLGPLSNMTAFMDAWGVKEGDAMWRKPEDRIEIW